MKAVGGKSSPFPKTNLLSWFQELHYLYITKIHLFSSVHNIESLSATRPMPPVPFGPGWYTRPIWENQALIIRVVYQAYMGINQSGTPGPLGNAHICDHMFHYLCWEPLWPNEVGIGQPAFHQHDCAEDAKSHLDRKYIILVATIPDGVGRIRELWNTIGLSSHRTKFLSFPQRDRNLMKDLNDIEQW